MRIWRRNPPQRGEPIVRYDRTDARILEIVQKNNRLTSEAIGELAGLSTSACQRRLKRLRSEGIIQADISIVSPKAVGRPIQVLALVSLERESSGIIDRFKKAIKSSVEVVNGFYVRGTSPLARGRRSLSSGGRRRCARLCRIPRCHQRPRTSRARTYAPLGARTVRSRRRRPEGAPGRRQRIVRNLEATTAQAAIKIDVKRQSKGPQSYAYGGSPWVSPSGY